MTVLGSHNSREDRKAVGQQRHQDTPTIALSCINYVERRQNRASRPLDRSLYHTLVRYRYQLLVRPSEGAVPLVRFWQLPARHAAACNAAQEKFLNTFHQHPFCYLISRSTASTLAASCEYNTAVTPGTTHFMSFACMCSGRTRRVLLRACTAAVAVLAFTIILEVFLKLRVSSARH